MIRLVSIILFLFLLPSIAQAVLVDSGTYAGNSTDDRNITVVFDPDYCVVFDDAGGAPWFTTDDVISDTAGGSVNWRQNAVTATNRIQALGTALFQVGTDSGVNGTGTDYFWVCMQDDGGGDFEIGTYEGNATDDRTISLGTITGTPEVVMIKNGDSTDSGAWRTASLSSNESMPFHQFGGLRGNEIQDFSTGGFQVGTGGETNASGETYFYIALGPGNTVDEGTYTGNGTDDRDITAPGWEPEYTQVKNSDGNDAIARTEAIGTDTSASFTFSAFTGANAIQDHISTGFEIGTADEVNTNTDTYYWYSVRDTQAAADTCTYGGTGNWSIDAADNCTITADVYVRGDVYLMELSGTGKLFIYNNATLSVGGGQIESTSTDIDVCAGCTIELGNDG